VTIGVIVSTGPPNNIVTAVVGLSNANIPTSVSRLPDSVNKSLNDTGLLSSK
jgi:hypothetical protein